MRNERLMILRMIEEGKITAAEGLTLLEALEEQEPWPHDAEPQPEAGSGPEEEAAGGPAAEQEPYGGTEKAGPGGPDPAEEASGRREEAGRQDGREEAEGAEWSFRFDTARLGEQVMQAVDRLGERLQEWFETGGGWITDWLGAGYSFPDSRSGEVPAGELLHVQVRLPNGKVTVEPSPDERYHLEWVAHVRGADRERAAERARQAVTVDEEEGRLVLRGRGNEGWWNFMGRVDATLRLPRQGRYRLDVTLANASLHLSEIRAERLRVRLANGSATVERAHLGVFDLKAANGRIRVDGCSARQGQLVTANGRVEFVGSAQRLRLATSNGRVQGRVAALAADQAAALPDGGPLDGLPAGEGVLAETVNGQVRLQLDAALAARALIRLRSLHGALEADLPDLKVWHREQAPGRNRLEAAGPQAGAEPFSVEARSQTGSVRVERWGAGEPWE